MLRFSLQLEEFSPLYSYEFSIFQLVVTFGVLLFFNFELFQQQFANPKILIFWLFKNLCFQIVVKNTTCLLLLSPSLL